MIANRQRRVAVPVQPLEEFAERALAEMQFPPESVGVELISDETMARLNWKFRQKRGPTDVLSFPADHETPSPESQYIGDIAISPETAQRNARAEGRDLEEELRILILHGMIHLAGFDHETDNGEMDYLEARLRRRLGLAGSSARKVSGGKAAAKSSRAKSLRIRP
jgi:probable rRNA maturation factor